MRLLQFPQAWLLRPRTERHFIILPQKIPNTPHRTVLHRKETNAEQRVICVTYTLFASVFRCVSASRFKNLEHLRYGPNTARDLSVWQC